MAYLILRIEPRDNDTKTRAEAEPIVERWSRRCRLEDPRPARITEELARRGYERAPPRGANPARWPLIAYVYVSQRADGKGRSASTLHRIVVRKT